MRGGGGRRPPCCLPVEWPQGHRGQGRPIVQQKPLGGPGATWTREDHTAALLFNFAPSPLCCTGRGALDWLMFGGWGGLVF